MCIRDSPYIQKQLSENLNINKQDLYALIWYYKMKEAKKYHLEITVSRSSKTHKFSEFALQFLREKLKELEDVYKRQQYRSAGGGMTPEDLRSFSLPWASM